MEFKYLKYSLRWRLCRVVFDKEEESVWILNRMDVRKKAYKWGSLAHRVNLLSLSLNGPYRRCSTFRTER